MSRKVLFIFNPFSGKGIIKSRVFDIVNTLSSNGYEVTVYPSQDRLGIYEFVSKRCQDFSLIIVGGGDGTLNEAVNGIFALDNDKRPPLGYIPTGSTNDFASSLSIPKKPLMALKAILNGESFKCDAGRFQKNYFVYVAAFGAFTDVAYGTPQEIKNYLGHMAYILEGIKRLPTIKSYVMDIEYDGNNVKGNFIYGMVSNSIYVGGVKSYKKQQVKFNDGLFECVFIREPQNPVEIQAIISGLLKQDFSHENFCTFRCSKINIKSLTEIDWTLDGEYGGAHKEVEIENVKEGFEIILGLKNKDKL